MGPNAKNDRQLQICKIYTHTSIPRTEKNVKCTVSNVVCSAVNVNATLCLPTGHPNIKTNVVCCIGRVEIQIEI